MCQLKGFATRPFSGTVRSVGRQLVSSTKSAEMTIDNHQLWSYFESYQGRWTMDAQKPREAPGKRLDASDVNKIYGEVVLGEPLSIL